MYEELVKQMRFCAEDCSVVECQDKCPNFGNYRPYEYCFSRLMAQAADAIEDLQKAVNFHKFNSEFWEDKYNSLADEKWISVTERLPMDKTEVLAYYGFVHDGEMSKIRFIGVLKYFTIDATPHWQHESMGLTVTHWMPLPEPPKDGE